MEVCIVFAVQYVLVGNYGVGNFGDEALKEYFLSAFPQVEWHVLSAHPQQGEFSRLPAGIRSLFTPWWKTFGALWRSDGVVFGGGTLFTDIESPWACFIWWWHALWARILRKKIFLTFQGIGPFKTAMGEWCGKWVVRHSAFISVRDSASYVRVQSWGLNLKVIQTCDPVFIALSSNKFNQRTQNLLCIIPRYNSTDSFDTRASVLSKERSWDGVQILSLQPENLEEQAVCAKLAERTKGTVISVRTLEDLAHRVRSASLVLTQRYHGAVAALALDVPFEVVSQGAGDKLAALIQHSAPEEWRSLAENGQEALRMAL